MEAERHAEERGYVCTGWPVARGGRRKAATETGGPRRLRSVDCHLASMDKYHSLHLMLQHSAVGDPSYTARIVHIHMHLLWLRLQSHLVSFTSTISASDPAKELTTCPQRNGYNFPAVDRADADERDA